MNFLLNQKLNKVITFHRRSKDKSQRATVEQVLDPRTRMILFKMLNKGKIKEVS